jgi:hypothetical protein
LKGLKMEEEELVRGMESSMRSAEDMTVNEYTNTLVDRINNLTDKEKVSLLDMFGSEEFQLIGRILGPEVTKTVGKQINFFAEEAIMNPEGVQPEKEFRGRMQREETEDQTEQMFRQPPPEMRVQEELEDQPDTLV